MFFSKLGGADNNFRSNSKTSQAGAKCLREGCPHLDLTPLEVRGGGDFNIPQPVTCWNLLVYPYYCEAFSITSSKTISNLPEVLNLNQSFLKLNQPICNWQSNLPVRSWGP
jgi:hypothetical protein